MVDVNMEIKRREPQPQLELNCALINIWREEEKAKKIEWRKKKKELKAVHLNRNQFRDVTNLPASARTQPAMISGEEGITTG